MTKLENPRSGETVLQVRNLWVRKGSLRRKKWILRDVSFNIKPGEFVAIIGPNGAGKTKLIEAISGDRPYSGEVLFYNQDLYADPEYWLPKIGWVPTHSVTHDSLTVDQALLQIGRLRLPGRPDEMIMGRVNQLMDQLEFPQDRRKALIRDLSTGERKRIELTAELLTRPHLLLLDEPTTNLDPDAERSLMQLLRDRSWGKRQAVLIVTHTLQSLQYCDRVIFMANGRIRAEGTHDQVLDELEALLGRDEPAAPASQPGALVNNNHNHSEYLDQASRWADIYRKSRKFEGEPPGEPPDRPTSSKPGRLHSRPKRLFHEVGLLLRRNWLLFRNNPAALLLYMLMGVFSGVLSRIVLRDNAFIQDSDVAGYSVMFDTTDARQAIFIIALVVTLLGLIGSFLDITKERQIYRYERVKGLSPWAYLISKWVVLVGLVGLMAPTFLMAVLTFQGQLVPSPWYVMLTLYLACIAAVTLGLAISAASSAERVATGLLGIVVVFHVFFSGGVEFNERMRAFLERISIFAASHWAAEGISSSIQLYCWASNPRFQDFYSLGHLASVWLNLLIYIMAGMILAFVALRLQDSWFPNRTRWQKTLANGGIWFLLSIILATGSWSQYLKSRSLDYYHLRGDADTVRITNSAQADLFQIVNGSISQSMCPEPTPLPPLPTPMVALPPTQAPPDNPLTTSEPLAPGLNDPTREPPPSFAPETTAVVDQLDDTSPPPLPRGQLTQAAQLVFGPEHANLSLVELPVASAFTILGRDRSMRWFRIKEESTGRELIGWIPIGATTQDASQAGLVASPPFCAAPRSFLGASGPAPLVEWNSDVAGHIVIVVDVFRTQAGQELPPTTLTVEINQQVLDTYPIEDTRQSFVFRGLAIEKEIQLGDRLRLFLSEGFPLNLRATIFFVPVGCSF